MEQERRITNYAYEHLRELIDDQSIDWEPLTPLGHTADEIARAAEEKNAEGYSWGYTNKNRSLAGIDFLFKKRSRTNPPTTKALNWSSSATSPIDSNRFKIGLCIKSTSV